MCSARSVRRGEKGIRKGEKQTGHVAFLRGEKRRLAEGRKIRGEAGGGKKEGQAGKGSCIHAPQRGELRPTKKGGENAKGPMGTRSRSEGKHFPPLP